MNTKLEYEHWSLVKVNKRRVGGAVALLLLLPVAAWAGGVVTSCTEAALRAAMAGGGVVTFDCDGTILLASTITNLSDTTLDGSGRQVTISGNKAARVFYVNTNVSFTVVNLTIANGRSDNGAGICNAGGYLNVQNCVLIGNTAIGQAGVAGGSGTNGCGGALFNAGAATIANSTFSSNVAVGAYGTSGSGYGGSGGSGASGYGGAIYNSGEVTVTNCTLNGNTAAGGAGGFGGGGGGGGAITMTAGGNGGTGGSSYGGALFNAGVAGLANTTLTENASTGGDGGSGGLGGNNYYNPGQNGGNGNAGGSGSGGGICNLTGHCFLTNCTLAFNPAIAGGGGAGGPAGEDVWGVVDGSPGLRGPAGSASGGGITASDGLFLINVLLAFNGPANCSFSIIDGGHNLSSDSSCGFTNVGSLNNSNPLLGPLMDNGGPTLTMALMPGSPAIDAGDNGAAPPGDQRGVLRPVGFASDIGAYECGPPAIMMPPPSQSVARGSTVDFPATAIGYPPLNYQWFFNGTNAIAGATNSVLHLVNVQPSQSGAYTLVVTNAFGAVTSSPAVLAVLRLGIVVTNSEAALRAAIAGGGTVTFACDGTITLSNTVVIGTNTALDGSGHQVTISGGDSVRVFYVNTNVTFSLNHLTIVHGRSTSGAGLFNANGTVNATNTTFDGNETLGAAGPPGWPGSAGGSVSGGAVANAGVINLINCSFTNNSAVAGAGSYGSGVSGYLGFSGGSGAGGAVWNSGLLTGSGCTFAGNSAAGGIGGEGGSTFQATWGAGAGGSGGDGSGGALFNCGIARLLNCTLAFNTGSGGTGGMGCPAFPLPPYTPGAPNGSPGLGFGGICDASGQCYLTNCTVAFNSCTGASSSPGTNSCGGIKTSGASMVNTLLAQNLPGCNCLGAITDLGHNLSSDTTCAFTNAGSMNNTYPLLGPLTDNGGPTATIALLPGSRAIDAGDSTAAPPTDQRGVPRPFGTAADIGAYEYNSPTNSGPSTVVTECTEAALRAAMSGGGTVTFACDGMITLTSTIMITTNTVLDAAKHQIIISGGFYVTAGVAFSLANLTVNNGGGILNAGGLVTATNCVFSGNYAIRGVLARGGAIRNESGVAYLSACVFTDNHAYGAPGATEANGLAGGSGAGGALDNSGTLTADLCRFIANSAVGAGGLSQGGPGHYGTPGGSGGDGEGGAVCNFGTMTILRSTFTSNSAAGGAGANGPPGFFGDMGLSGGAGSAAGSGGAGNGSAIYNAGTLRVINTTFAANSGAGANGGAGGAGGGSEAGPGVSGGSGGRGGAGGTGAGAILNSGSVQLVNCTFAFNSGSGGNGGAGGGGGSGVFGGNGGSGGSGGSGFGAICDQSSCGLTNCTFASDSGASGVGGAGGGAGSGTYQNGSPGASGSPGSGAAGIRTTGARVVNTLLADNR